MKTVYIFLVGLDLIFWDSPVKNDYFITTGLVTVCPCPKNTALPNLNHFSVNKDTVWVGVGANEGGFCGVLRWVD